MENAGEVNAPVEIGQEKPQRKFFGLSQNVFVFGFVSMLTDFSSEVTVKILPLFLANALGVKPAIIGFIEGLAESTATILKWVFGWLSDRMKKRKWLDFLRRITDHALCSASPVHLHAFDGSTTCSTLRTNHSQKTGMARKRGVMSNGSRKGFIVISL